MNRYIIKLTPLEFYFFGDENAFHFDENGKQISDSYYARSLELPPQSSIIGMLRYVLLEQSGILRSDAKYSESELGRIKELIGAKSYDVENPNELGQIIDVSPLFVVDGEGNKYIRTPLNHKKGEEKFTPFEMSDNPTETSQGEINLPKDGEFNPKAESKFSLLRLNDLAVFDDIFETDERVGIAKGKDKDGLFKKCYCKLKDNYSFAVVADFADDIEIKDTVCYMGREKSSFKLEADKMETEGDKGFEPEINGKGLFYYAWSDLVLKEKLN
ncbi:MAG: hypothetical protein K5664_07375, partial [Firmicutes bacterium]|nr:hypothetical protein [Bacillota bacterium]